MKVAFSHNKLPLLLVLVQSELIPTVKSAIFQMWQCHFLLSFYLLHVCELAQDLSMLRLQHMLLLEGVGFFQLHLVSVIYLSSTSICLDFGFSMV